MAKKPRQKQPNNTKPQGLAARPLEVGGEIQRPAGHPEHPIPGRWLPVVVTLLASLRGGPAMAPLVAALLTVVAIYWISRQ